MEDAAREQYPEHFRRWVTSRFEGIDAGFAWDRYLRLLAAGALDTPLFDAPRDVPQMAAAPLLARRDQVDDVMAIAAIAAPEEPFDVFISYIWGRTGDDAAWLRDELRSRGVRVFFDKDHLDVSQVPEQSIKRELIQRLRATVESARAWVVFAAELRPFALPEHMQHDEALRRGLAMQTDDDQALLVAWNWQTLEMRHMGARLVIGERAVYMVGADGRYAAEFGKRPARGREAIVEHVLAYLRAQRVLVGT